jgi:hypothetical protein
MAAAQWWCWEAALGVSVGRRHWAAVEDAGVALGGASGKRTCNNGVGISVIKEPPLASPLQVPPTLPSVLSLPMFYILKE